MKKIHENMLKCFLRNYTYIEGPDDVTVNDLTIPDSYCSIKDNPHNPYGLKCRDGFRCMNLANRSRSASKSHESK